jgi:hypothetical protein
MGRVSPGHKIPRTETEPKNTENRTEKYPTEEIWFLVSEYRIYRGTYRSTEFGPIAIAQQQPTKKF